MPQKSGTLRRLCLLNARCGWAEGTTAAAAESAETVEEMEDDDEEDGEEDVPSARLC